MRDRKIIGYLQRTPLLLRESVLHQFLAIVDRHARGDQVDADEVRSIVEMRDAASNGRSSAAVVRDGVAVIPIGGVIAPHASMVNGASQPRGTSIEQLRAQFRAANNNLDVHTILFDVESPGGSSQGVDELAEEIRTTATKRTVAYSDAYAASAAYYIASAAQETYGGKTSSWGSIGVYSYVDDVTGAFEQEGVKRHLVTSGGVKGHGLPGTPVTDELRKEMQSNVDKTNDLFVAAVAAGRGVGERFVREQLNNGRMWDAADAIDLQLIDGIATFEGLLARLQQERGEKCGDEEELAARAADNSEGGEMTNNSENGVALQSSADLEKARAEGVEAERARVKAIQDAAHADQRELADQLIEDGKSAEEAQEWLHADLRDRYDALCAAKVEAPVEPKAEPAPLYGSANAPVYGSTEEVSANVVGRKKDLGAMSREELHAFAAADWAARTDELRHEYMSLEGYEGNLIVLWKQAREGVN